MKAPQAPRLETRRTREFSAELQERARAWIPAWEVTDAEGDFGRALLEIAHHPFLILALVVVLACIAVFRTML